MATASAKASARNTGRQPAAKSVRRVKNSGTSTATKSVASSLPQVTGAAKAAAKRKFEQGVVARGEATPAGKPMPPGATHEVVGKASDGSPMLKRRRFSLK